MERYTFKKDPVADPAAVVGGGDKPYRFTILTDGVVRFEYAADCVFEDRASTFATTRKLPVPKFRVLDQRYAGFYLTVMLYSNLSQRPHRDLYQEIPSVL